MNELNTLVARVDTALDTFWIGFVLRKYHQAQAKRYSRKARSLAQTFSKHPALEVVSHQARRHALEAELISGI